MKYEVLVTAGVHIRTDPNDNMALIPDVLLPLNWRLAAARYMWHNVIQNYVHVLLL